MNKNITEVVFILDASGSMYHLTSDTIGGFNAMLKKQKETEGQVLVNVVTFNSQARTIIDRVPIDRVPEMSEKDYQANGSTALLDAIGSTIDHISTIHKYIRKEDVPGQTLFMITTDGYENASRQYSRHDIRKLIEKKKQAGWEFVFMGATEDAIETAASYGIGEDKAVRFVSDEVGTARNYEAMDKCITMARCGCVDVSWKDDIEADVKRRGGQGGPKGGSQGGSRGGRRK